MSMTNPLDTVTDPVERSAERPSLGASVGAAAQLITSEKLSNGDRAELRRVSPEAPFTPALWKVLHLLGQDTAPDWYRQETWERRWATLLMGMTHCAGLHDYKVSSGEALEKAGWSELRFVQLLRAEGEGLEKHVRRVAQYLASKNQPANWAEVANLLFYQSGDTAESVRLSIARNYYSTRHKKQNQSE